MSAPEPARAPLPGAPAVVSVQELEAPSARGIPMQAAFRDPRRVVVVRR